MATTYKANRCRTVPFGNTDFYFYVITVILMYILHPVVSSVQGDRYSQSRFSNDKFIKREIHIKASSDRDANYIIYICVAVSYRLHVRRFVRPTCIQHIPRRNEFVGGAASDIACAACRILFVDVIDCVDVLHKMGGGAEVNVKFSQLSVIVGKLLIFVNLFNQVILRCI